jgi:molybdate transport system regulatory protein
MSDFQVRSKVWLEVCQKPFFGDGRYRLLQAIDRTGSINAAARDLGISFRKAWALLAVMEEHAPFPLVERRTGGKGGGETRLTPEAQELLEKFAQLREQVNLAADNCFTDVF